MTREEKIEDLQRQIDELKELPNGVWYKSEDETAIVKKLSKNSGIGYNYKDWQEGDWDYEDDLWQPATTEEIEATVKKHWKELNPDGLDFECLWNKKIGEPSIPCYLHLSDTAWSENGCFYYNGTFATPIKKKMIRMCDSKNRDFAIVNKEKCIRAFGYFISLEDPSHAYSVDSTLEVELITEPFTITFNTK